MSRHSQAKRAARAKQRSRHRARERQRTTADTDRTADFWSGFAAEAEPEPTESDQALLHLRSVADPPR